MAEGVTLVVAAAALGAVALIATLATVVASAGATMEASGAAVAVAETISGAALIVTTGRRDSATGGEGLRLGAGVDHAATVEDQGSQS